MSWIKRLVLSLRGGKLEDDLERELEFHLEMRTREKTSAGASPGQARREALQRFGSVTRTKEACREKSTLPWMRGLGQDLRYSCRNLYKNPGFAAAAAACLAIGIGANAAVFSFVNAFLFQPLPQSVFPIQRASGNAASYPELQDWRTLHSVFMQVFAYTPGERFTIGRSEDGEPALGETVTATYFQALGIVPAIGRLLAPDDELRPLAVIGYEFWRNRYQGNPAIAGKTIWINREAFTIAGVAPPGFQGMLAPWSTDLWVTPYLHRDSLSDRRAGWMRACARLAPGVTQRQAEVAINALDAELARQHPDPRRQRRDSLTLHRRSGLSGSEAWGVFLIMGVLLMTVTCIIFLIACANVAGLLIANAAARRREILIRLSLGASRGRLVRQLLTESSLLGLMGAVAGIAMAFAAGDSLASLMPRSITGGFHFRHGIDGHVLAFTVVLSLVSILFVGLLPALRASDEDLAAAGRTQTAMGGRTPRLRQWLIVAQVAASVVVLTTAGVFVRAFQRAQAADPGYDTSHLLTVELRGMRTPRARATEFYRELKAHLASLPGVVSVSFADVLPLASTRVVTIEGQGEVATSAVDSTYFRAMAIHLVRGREPRPDEHDIAVVNAALAARLWPNEDPVGKSIRLRTDGPRQEIVGVTATGKYWSLSEPARPFLYQILEPTRRSGTLSCDPHPRSRRGDRPSNRAGDPSPGSGFARSARPA